MAETSLSAAASSGRGAAARRLGNLLASLIILPLLVPYRVSALALPDRTESIFQGYSQLLSLFPGTSGNWLRRAFYRATLQRCSDTCLIGFGTIFSTPEAEIGEHVYIGARCMLGRVTLERDVLLGSNVDVLSGRNQHRFDRTDLPIRLQGGTRERVTIGEDCWLGNGASVAADVAPHSIVAVGAVVVKPVEAWSIVGGNPARVLSRRSSGAAATVLVAASPLADG